MSPKSGRFRNVDMGQPAFPKHVVAKFKATLQAEFGPQLFTLDDAATAWHAGALDTVMQLIEALVADGSVKREHLMYWRLT